MSSSDSERVQSVRNAWINALRAEVLRVGRDIPEVARVVTVGMWIATYADADGSNAFPGRDTLATLAGCSQETVTRSVRVLMGVGVLGRKRRPNSSAMYQLLMPLGGGLDWKAHIHHYTDNRWRKAHAKKKEREAAEVLAERSTDDRTASMHADRTASTSTVPDSVHAGGSEPSPGAPDSVHAHPRIASTHAVRTACTPGVYQYIPTSGRDPLPDHKLAEHSPQPQQGAPEAVEDESSIGERPADKPAAADEAVPDRARLTRCTGPDCGLPLIRPTTDGLCAGCRAHRDRERDSA